MIDLLIEKAYASGAAKARIYFLAILLLFGLILHSGGHAALAQDEAAEKDPAAIFNLAQDAHEKGDFEAALKLYNEALGIIPEFPEAEYQKARVLISLGKAAEAEKSFGKAIELKEDWSLPMAGLALLLIKRNALAEAENLLNRAIALDEANFPAYSALTELRIRQNAAIPLLKELLAKLTAITAKARPTASIWASRGALERKLGDMASARSSLSKAIQIDPKNEFAISERIEVYIAEGDLESALDEAQKLLALNPADAAAKISLARVLAKKGEKAEALKLLSALGENNPEAIALRNHIAADAPENIAELEKALASNPKSAALLGRLCGLTRTSDPPKSIEYCRRALEAEPSNINHAIGFAAALVQAKQFPAAASILRKILDVAPDNYTARANLAVSLFQQKLYSEAKEEYERLTEMKPSNAIAYYFLAICYDNLQEYLDAMANYQKFLKLASKEQNSLEIDKVNLRLPALQKQINSGAGKKGKKT